MNFGRRVSVALVVASSVGLGLISVAHAQQGEDLREAAQNPIADLISLPVISQPPFLSGPELHSAEQVFGSEIGETEFGLGDLTPESIRHFFRQCAETRDGPRRVVRRRRPLGFAAANHGGRDSAANRANALAEKLPLAAVEQIPGGYKILDANGQSLAYVYGRETRADADTANVLTMDEAWRIASNIAKLPTFLAAQSFRE